MACHDDSTINMILVIVIITIISIYTNQPVKITKQFTTWYGIHYAHLHFLALYFQQCLKTDSAEQDYGWMKFTKLPVFLSQYSSVNRTQSQLSKYEQMNITAKICAGHSGIVLVQI